MNFDDKTVVILFIWPRPKFSFLEYTKSVPTISYFCNILNALIITRLIAYLAIQVQSSVQWTSYLIIFMPINVVDNSEYWWSLATGGNFTLALPIIASCCFSKTNDAYNANIAVQYSSATMFSFIAYCWNYSNQALNYNNICFMIETVIEYKRLVKGVYTSYWGYYYCFLTNRSMKLRKDK